MKKSSVLEVSFCLLDLFSVGSALLQFECHRLGWGTCILSFLHFLTYTILNYLLFIHIFTAFLTSALQSCKGRSQSSDLFIP